MGEVKALKQALVPVQGINIPTVIDDEGEVWVALRPVVNALGLDWGTQRKKLKNLKEKGVVILTTPLKDANGKIQEMLTINLYDLPVYLYSININKVKPQLREKIKKFQVETTIAIRTYWKEKFKKEREELEKIKAQYDKLVKELRGIPTYEEYRRIKEENDKLRIAIDMIRQMLEDARPYLKTAYGWLDWVEKGFPIENNKVKMKREI